MDKQGFKATGGVPSAKPISGDATYRYRATRLHPVIWEGVRAHVLNAYEGRCGGCGCTVADAYEAARPRGPGLWATAPLEANWHAHHRLPVVMGGGAARRADEFLLLCATCHDRASARERRSRALRSFLLRAHRILRMLQRARFSRPLLRKESGIARDSFNQTLRWLYRVECIAGDAKSIGLTRRGEEATRQLDIHCRPTPQEQCIGPRPVHWFANGIFHSWLRPHLALLVATECGLLLPVTEPIPLPCGETTADPESNLRFAAHLIERMAAISNSRKMLPPTDVALLVRVIEELYVLEEWLHKQIGYSRKASQCTDARGEIGTAGRGVTTRE